MPAATMTRPAAASGDAPAVLMQGIQVPASSVDPQAFARLTRRMVFPIKNAAYSGLGSTDIVPILQTGIVSALEVRFVGTVVVTLGGGTMATTARWPYDLIKSLKVSANGQSNLINVGGCALKLMDVVRNPDLNDRGVTNGFGGASPGTSRTQGTLALNSESWGMGAGVSAVAGAPTTYTVDLTWHVPVAFDDVTLTGAIFAQTAATDLNLVIDWATSADLFTFTGAAAAVVAGTLQVDCVTYSIPQGPNGDVIVPDLSVFHQLIQSRQSNITNSANEVKLAGQGLGRQLQRLFWRTFSSGVPLAVNDTNYGRVGWRYGGNDTPEDWLTGGIIRQQNERLFGADIGMLWGWVGFDWANAFAFRDAIDEGAATELRFISEQPSGLSLTTPFVEYVQETLFPGAVGA